MTALANSACAKITEFTNQKIKIKIKMQQLNQIISSVHLSNPQFKPETDTLKKKPSEMECIPESKYYDNIYLFFISILK